MELYRQHAVPERIRALSTLDRLDYIDVVIADASDARVDSPEEWARATMEGASYPGRYVVWRLVLRLNLALEPSSAQIAGWRIVDRGPTWIRTETRSWFMTAQIIFGTADDQVSFATCIRYDHAFGARLWPVVSITHRAIAPGFLESGMRRLRRRREGVPS